MRARDLLANPEDSLTAWVLLKEWVDGFIKNSRNRVKGQSVFISKREKAEYDDLNVIMTNVAAIPSLDDQSSDLDSAEVSVFSLLQLLFYVCPAEFLSVTAGLAFC